MPFVVDEFAAGVAAAATTVIEAGAATAPFSGIPPSARYASDESQKSCALPTDQEMQDGSYADPGGCVCYEEGPSVPFDSPGMTTDVETAPPAVTGDRPSPAPQPATARSSTPTRDQADKVIEPAKEKEASQPPPDNIEDSPVDDFNRHVTATNEAFAGAMVGHTFPPIFELLLDIALIGQENTEYGRTVRELAEEAMRETREFGERSVHVASEKSESGALAGSVLGGLGPDVVSPSSKAKAGAKAVNGAKMLADGATAVALEKLIQKLADAGGKYKGRLKALLKRLAGLAEKSQAYKALHKEGKIYTVPGKKSAGRWWEERTSFKSHQFEGTLNKGIQGTKTVQIDDLLVAGDGRLVLVEAKAMNVADKIDSAHFKFPDKKLDQILRYIQFAKENPKLVSHVQILGNKVEVAEIYFDALAARSLRTGDGISRADIERLVEFGRYWVP